MWWTTVYYADELVIDVGFGVQCVCEYVCVCVYVSVLVCVCVYESVCACVYVCEYVRMRVYVHVLVRMRVAVHSRTTSVWITAKLALDLLPSSAPLYPVTTPRHTVH